MIVQEIMKGQGALEDGLVVGDVIGGNPKAQGGVGGVGVIVINHEVGDHGEQILIHKHKVPSGRGFGIGGYAVADTSLTLPMTTIGCT